MVEHPFLPESWVGEAQRLHAAGDLDGAFAAYQRAWEIPAESRLKAPQAGAAYHAALMMIRARRFAEALVALQEVMSIADWHWAEAGYHRSVLIRDEGADPWSHLAGDDGSEHHRRPDLDTEMGKGFRFAVRSEDPAIAAESRAALRDLGEDVPEPTADDVTRADPEAGAAIHAVRASDPDPVVASDAEWLLHAIRRHQGRYAESAEHVRRAIALDSRGSATVDRWVRLADVLVLAGLPRQALVALDAGWAEGSTDDEPTAWRVRAAAQAALGRDTDARESRAHLAMISDDREDLPEPPVTLPQLASVVVAGADVTPVLRQTRAAASPPRRPWPRRG